MSKKICKKLKDGAEIPKYDDPKFLCKTCSAVSVKDNELCKPKKAKRA